MLLNKYTCTVIALLFPLVILAHGDLSIRIANVTTEISKDTGNASLYFDRGFLYQQHEEFNNALNDYMKSESLGYVGDVLHYRTAEVYFALNEFSMALASTNKYGNMSDVKIRKLRAQILLKLNRYSEALNDYNFVVNNLLDITPSDIIEYSEIFLLIKRTNFEEAVKAIDMGLKKLGNGVITLRSKKIEYLIKWNQSERVIQEYDALIAEFSRKEFWYYKKALFLYEINRISECELALQQVDASIKELSPRFKNTPAIKDLRVDLLNFEKKLSDKN
ncbi:MAG: hypothetical protein IH948_03435 [Bacteroidetes bacterium]|nr:hypothetical protein [Bacteroidota bacterium]